MACACRDSQALEQHPGESLVIWTSRRRSTPEHPPTSPAGAQVRAVLRAGHHRDLLQWDELNRDRQAGRVFAGWQEGAVAFPPTFKFRRGTSQYIGAPPKAMQA